MMMSRRMSRSGETCSTLEKVYTVDQLASLSEKVSSSWTCGRRISANSGCLSRPAEKTRTSEKYNDSL